MHPLRKGSRSFRIYAEIDTATSHSHSHRVKSQLRKESPATLKHELLKIHHRHSNDRRKAGRQKRRPARRPSRVGDGSSESSLLSNLKGASYSKDYSKLSKEFVVASRYHINMNKSRKGYPTCVKCKMKRSKKVVFPCEHLCVCSACLDNDIPKQCPICKCPVHVVLDYSDDIIDRYWLWLDEGKSPLTTSFTECFQLKSYDAIDAAIVIQQRSEAKHGQETDDDVKHKHCDENIFQRQKRRSSWMNKILCPIASVCARARSVRAL